MKMKSIHLFAFVCSLLLLQSVSYGQAEKQLCGTYQKENLRNIAKEDADLIDQFGNYYTFNELVAPQLAQQVRSGGAVCQCGVFQLTFTGFTTAEEETICAVFNYVSGIITTGGGGDQPIINVVKKPMDQSVLGLGTTFFTPDCGIANNFIFDVMNSGAAATQPPGTASGVLCINSLIPMYTMNETPSAGEFDLYTVALHEVLHILGFSSQIGPNGDSNQGYYSMWDAFLFSGDDNEFLITPGATPPPGCCDFSEFNPNLNFNNLITSDCNMNIFFNNTQIAEVYGEGAGDIGNLLSHLNRCGSGGNQYVMHAGIAPLEQRRVLTQEEIDILLMLGYTPTGATEEPCRVIAVDDVFEAVAQSWQEPTDRFFSINIDYDEIVANDDFVDPDGNGNITLDEIEFTFTGCGTIDIDPDINGGTPNVFVYDELITVAALAPCSSFDICYTIRGCDQNGDGIPDLCDDGIFTVFRECLPCLPTLAACPPPACGDNLVCRGDFNELSPQEHHGISQSTGSPPCGFEGSPDVLWVNNNDNLLRIFTSEALGIPLMTPIQPGCSATISFVGGGRNGNATVSVFASVAPPCTVDFVCPPPAGADYNCMGGATVPNGWSDIYELQPCGPNFPNVDCSCIDEVPVVVGPLNLTAATISNVVNTTQFPLEFIYITTSRDLYIDDISVTSNCDNEIIATLEDIEEVCIGEETEFEVEICLTGANTTPVDIELTANIPQILGLSIAPGSPFEGGSLMLNGVVPSSNCITTTLNLLVGFSVPAGTELPISIDLSTPNACLDAQSLISANPMTIECEIPCELAAYPTVTPVCGSQLGCINFVVAGGSGNYFYTLTGNLPTTDPEFCGLAAGIYAFAIVDQNDEKCRTEIEVEVVVDPHCAPCIILEDDCDNVEFEYCCDGTLNATFSGVVHYVKIIENNNWGTAVYLCKDWSTTPCAGSIGMTLNPNSNYLIELNGGDIGNDWDEYPEGTQLCEDELIRIPTDFCSSPPLAKVKGGIQQQPGALVEVFPNPAKDYLRVSNPEGHNLSIEIYNTVGQRLLRKNVSQAFLSTLNIADLPHGIYMVQVKDLDNKQYLTNEKLVVVK